MQMMRAFVLALVASGFFVVGGAEARADLVGYYTFDDNTADDSSGNGNDAALQGPAAITAGGGGLTGGAGDRALDLGTVNNGAGATIANAATGAFDGLTANNAGSVSLWIFGNAAQQPTSDTAFGLYDAGNNRQFQSHLPWGDGTIYFDVGGGAGGANRISKAEPTAANYEGQWNHYVFVKDGGQSRIYQNGALWHSGGTSAAIGSITQAFIGSEVALNNSYSGQIDEFSIFDRALTAQEIQRLSGGAEASVIEGFRNIALLGTASQSSTLSNPNNPVAGKAIDGNTSGLFNDSSTTHTNTSTPPAPVFWEVTLPGDVMIADARLWNRTDCCGGRLSNYTVTVFDESNATVFSQSYHVGSGQTGVSEFIDIPDTVVGNRVRVELIGGANNSDTILSLAEVQVFGMIRNGDNFAPFGSATQSSTLAPAERGNDGNRNGIYANGSVTHTAAGVEPDPWWRVDLGVDRYIDGVQLFERTDACCTGRLNNFDVRVLDASLNVVWEGVVADVPNAGNRIGVGTGFGSFGRYVEIQLNDTGSNRTLELAEVEVYAGKVQNIARNPNAVASQSSTAGVRTANHAIDGNVAGHESSFAQNPYAHTDNIAGSWWEVDLGGKSEIENILLYNRLDCCQARLSNFRVSIEHLGAIVWSEDFFTGGGNVGEMLRIDLDEKIIGRLVRVELLGLNSNGDNVLQLAEVQVWGTVIPAPAALPAGLILLGLVGIRRRR